MRGCHEMKSKELIKIGHELFGERGWQTQMSAALEVDTSTIRRWMYADSVPGPAAVALRMMLRIRQVELAQLSRYRS